MTIQWIIHNHKVSVLWSGPGSTWQYCRSNFDIYCLSTLMVISKSVVWLSQSHLIIRGTIRVSVLSKCQSRVIWIIDKHNISAHWDCDHTTTWQYCLRILTWSSESQVRVLWEKRRKRGSLCYSHESWKRGWGKNHVRKSVAQSVVWLSQRVLSKRLWHGHVSTLLLCDTNIWQYTVSVLSWSSQTLFTSESCD